MDAKRERRTLRLALNALQMNKDNCIVKREATSSVVEGLNCLPMMT
jgi:hypothetical protein